MAAVKNQKELYHGRIKNLEVNVKSIHNLKTDMATVKTKQELHQGRMKYLEEEVNTVRVEVNEFKEREIAIRVEIQALKNSVALQEQQSKAKEEEEELSHVHGKNLDKEIESLRNEMNGLKEREVALRVEVQALKNSVAVQEQQLQQQTIEEDFLPENQSVDSARAQKSDDEWKVVMVDGIHSTD
jgi:chromosome segregation ATPase